MREEYKVRFLFCQKIEEYGSESSIDYQTIEAGLERQIMTVCQKGYDLQALSYCESGDFLGVFKRHEEDESGSQ